MVGGVRSQAGDVSLHLPVPPLQVALQEVGLGIVVDFNDGRDPASPARADLDLAGSPRVLRPLCCAPWLDHEVASVDGQDVDDDAARLAGLATTHAQGARARDADARLGEPTEHLVEGPRCQIWLVVTNGVHAGLLLISGIESIALYLEWHGK